MSKRAEGARLSGAGAARATSSEVASDVALLSAIARGDRSAFAQFYQRYSSRMFGLVLKIVGRRDLAEDILQEVFLQIWRKAGDYQPEASRPLVWLMLITRARSIDWLRRQGTEAAWLERSSGILAGDGLGQPPGQDLADETQRARQALAALPLEQAEALSLAFYRGLTCGQIAALRRLPLGTVKTRIRLGMLRLRDILLS